MSARSRKLVKLLLGSLAALIVLIGLLFAAFGYVVGRVPEYRVQLQGWLNERTGLAVEFRTLGARLRLYGPELVFNDAVVRTPDRTRVLATARRGSVAFDLWNSIWNGRLTAGRFSLLSPEIGLIRTREGKIQLLGQSALPERMDTPFAIEQLPTGRFHVEKAVVSFRDELTGRGPWSLSGVSFDLTRDPQSLRLRGDASLPKALGRGLEFTARVEGALEESAQLASTFSVEGKGVDLSGWADVLPDEWPAPENGHGSLRVTGAMQGSALTQLSAKVNLSNVAATLPAWTIPLPTASPMHQPGSGDAAEEASPPHPKFPIEAPHAAEPPAPALPEMVSYSHVAFELRAQKLADAWSLSLQDLELARANRAWRAKEISAKWSRQRSENGPGELKISGKADRIELGALWPLLAYWPESEQLARVRALDAGGTIENLSLDYERAEPAAAATYSVQAKIDKVAFEPVARSPGLSGLSGQLRATDQGGEFQLASLDASFELPRTFRDVLTAQALDGSIQWRRGETGWTVQADNVRVRNEDGRGVARFVATIPGDDSSPVLDLSAQAEDLKVSSAHKYIPAGQLGAKTMEWFDRAFVDGRVVNADLTYKGPMRAFPFRKDEGTFLARGHVENAVFDYQPDWTPARDVVADIEFHNEGMRIHATSAAVGELHVEDATADIADFRNTRLVIDAAASGDLRDGLQFLKGSPLGPKLGEQFARLSGQGGLTANLHLDLPLRRLADREVTVTAHLADATMSMQNVDAPVKKLDGSLTVRNTMIAAAQMQGSWLGGPLDLAVGAEGAAPSVLNARGRASAAQLKPLLPSTVNVSGAADWHLVTDISHLSESVPRIVRIDSNLQGFGIALPEPVGKREVEQSPLQLTLELDNEDGTLLARGSLGNVRSLIRARRSADGWELDRGGLRADGVAPALPSHRGLRIEGAIEHFVLDEWLALRGTGGGGGGGKSLSDYLQAANVRVGTFELYGYRWPDVRGILQSTSAGWRVDVTGANAVGQILIPENFTGAQPLRATLERLVIEKTASAQKDEKGAAQGVSDPRNLPNLQVYVADLRLGQRAIGAVDLKASRVEQGIRFDSVTVSGNSARAEGRGEWLVTPEGKRSSLSATVSSSNVAATLRSLDYPEFIEAKRGEIRADLSWPGGFDDTILEHASGGIAVDADGGQLVNLQPGAGRVLGLFSVAALPRRLALDFKDLTEKGLAFDTVHGDFELRDGNAYTTNLLLRGPAAEIGIAGRTGLAARDYDQTAVVTGNLGVSVPVAGALAGGPAVGAALLLFSQVFKEPLKGITRGYYRITGPWDDPIVERVDASAVKAAASGY